MEPASTSAPHNDLYNRNGVLAVGALDRFPGLVHGVTTRSAPSGGDWNMSVVRGTTQHPASAEVARAHREELAAALGISLDRMVGIRQMHTSLVALVGEKDAGRGMLHGLPIIEGADAMVTATPDLYLLALSADCPPVFFHDPVREVVGLAHSGWKGSVGRIAGNVVEVMVDDFGSDPRHIMCVVGPGIGPCCYNVGQNLITEVEAEFMHPWDGAQPLLAQRDNLIYFNLRECIRRAIIEAGVPAENVTVEEVCTSHNLDLFYSHRAEKGQCGLFGAVLGIRGK